MFVSFATIKSDIFLAEMSQKISDGRFDFLNMKNKRSGQITDVGRTNMNLSLDRMDESTVMKAIFFTIEYSRI